MKVGIDKDSELVKKAQASSGIIDLKELIEIALKLLIKIDIKKIT